MSRMVGTVSRGVRAPIIRSGDDLVEIVTKSVLEAAAQPEDGFAIRDRDVVAMTEAIVARAQGNYASVDDIAADVKQDAFKACFIALFTHAAAVQFALAIERGNDDCIRVGLDCSGDVFFLRNHHAEVDNLKPCIRECMVEDFVADSMHICADYADDKLLLVAHSFCPRNSYFLFHK